MASSMSWLMYAIRSTSRTIRPSSVAGGSSPVWRRMPSRTCSVRFSRSVALSAPPPGVNAGCGGSARRSARARRRRAPPRRCGRTAGGRGRGRAPIASVRSSFSPSARATVRAIPRRLERVREPRAVVVALGRDEHLRLVLEAPERLRVHDPVAVALERRAVVRVGLRLLAHGRVRAHGERREPLVFERLDPLPERCPGQLRHPALDSGTSLGGRREGGGADVQLVQEEAVGELGLAAGVERSSRPRRRRAWCPPCAGRPPSP